eukprot:CAMPEP_0183703174 /NCGR_PEP_ID=MMETSP0737-20130205/1013_1 /TAXON_ID=385413 /ORGANISM="Thalassiosira miniscula, Strain CCMP1093" /LENGTH=964 /DNA_ID=CAMNT_0025929889 /DNA_START=494 /DNA_END=3388 /DNA_ORIENTATION=-
MGKRREKLKKIGKKLLPHQRKHGDRGAHEEASNNNETQTQLSSDDDDDDDDDHFGTSNPYDERFTEYNADVRQREELIHLHELAITISKSKSSETNVDDKRKASTSTTSSTTTLVRGAPRKAIFATPMDLALAERLSVDRVSVSKPPELAQFLFEALSDNFLFDVIDDELKRSLVDAMEEESFDAWEWVMYQGETGDSFYIIAEGSVAYYTEDNLAPGAIGSASPTNRRLIRTSTRASTFGGLAMLYDQVRPTSVLATTPLRLYKMDQRTFRSLMTTHKEQRRDDVMALLEEENSLFCDLGKDQLHKLADAFSWVNYREGERIVNKGDDGSILYIVKSGEVKLHNIGHGLSKFEDQVLGVGGYFGERALFENETRGRAANVTSVTESSLLAISKKTLEQIIGPIEQAILRASHSKFLRSIPLMRDLQINEINCCVQFLKEEQFKKDDKICPSGKLYLIQEGDALMVLHGVVSGGKEGESRLVRLKKGDYFGDLWSDDSVDGEEEEEEQQETVNAETDLTCLTLEARDVERVIGDMTRLSLDEEPLDDDEHDESAQKYLKMNGRKLERLPGSRQMGLRSMNDIFKSQMIKPTHYKMKLTDLKKVKMLGAGAFGKVWLVTSKEKPKDGSTPKAYALKMISKRQLIDAKLVAAVLREKNVMESIQHPLLLNLVESFQDENYLYLMLNLVLGGELFDLLYGKNKVTFDNEEWKSSSFHKSFGPQADAAPGQGVGIRTAVFYSACVIDAFAHLYNRQIVYRDLKPENIMIDSKGYCVLVDMGFAKVVIDKTYTLCGTPEYLSPEVILNVGHNHATDHWSFGCLLYEFIVGRTPFYRKNSMDQISLMRRIVRADYQYPDFCSGLSPNSQGLDKVLFHWKDLTYRLLRNNPADRLGNLSGGIEDIIGHGWFGNIDFHELRGQEKVPAPWVPDVKDPLDPRNKTNVDDPHTDQKELFVKELSDDDQKAFKGF